MILGIIVLVIIIILAIYVMKTYNTFITLGERVRNGKAQIAVQIESRFDAVRTLIDATKKYVTHEAETLEDIVRQRISISQDTPIEKIEQENDQLSTIIGRLIAIAENYPDLKASEVYVQTMDSIDQYENNVRNSRMIYNDVVTNFNRMVRMFPSNIIARMFNFSEQAYFKGTDIKQEMASWE